MKPVKKAIALFLGIGLSSTNTMVTANEDYLNEILLESAVPLSEYEDRVVASGGERFRHKLGMDVVDNDNERPSFMEEDTGRELGNSYYNNGGGNDDNANDDYFKYSQSGKAISFNGYALKYATCQKVQRYSVNAVQRGEYSSMVTDDIVILRLCPQRSCNSNSHYGCSSGYGEYAMDVSDYMTIVMKYQADKQSNFCSFCDACGGSSSSSTDDEYYNQTQSNAYQTSYQYTSSGQNNVYDSSTCYEYANECQNVATSCNSGDDDASQTNATNYLSYLDSFGCQKKKYNQNYFWVTPHCDTSTNTIQMGIFYDNYCNQDATDSGVDISNFLGDDFDTSVFSSVQNQVGCLDCGTSVSTPCKKIELFLIVSRR